MGFSALIVAAGKGERAGGGLPKQYRPVAGKPLIRWSADVFLGHPECDELIVAALPDHYDRLNAALAGLAFTLAEGGATRSASVENGLTAASCDQVFIHDAARPAVSAALIGRLLAALTDHAGAAPALPVADALARTGGNGPEPVNRDGLVRLQTPQAFRAAELRSAFAKNPGRDFPDELALACAAGLDVALVPGEEANFKLTWPEDFDRMDRQLQPAPRQALPVVGTGFDVHRLGPGDGVTLCGVFIACPYELIGHSDADVGLHALTDAVLGAAGLGDIGLHFPPSDMRWKGVDSAQFLVHAITLAREAGVRPVNADITLICETPKIGPHREAMTTRVAELTGLPAVRVNVKATTTERLGFTGRGEGVAAQAVFSGVIA